MKRSSIAALIVGVLVSAIIIALQATHLLAPLEEAVRTALTGNHPTTKVVGTKIQYTLVVFLSLGVAWLILTSSRRKKLHWPIAVLGIELLVVTWVCLLYQVFFQPLPSVFAIALGFVTASGYSKFGKRSGSGVARDYFTGRVSAEQYARIASGEVAFSAEAKTHDATAVVCDIANKHDLADECTPSQLADITEKFFAHATDSFLQAGAYIETVTGEGIVAIFGFPADDIDQAERATRHALALLESFEKLRAGRDAAFQKFAVHFGISSGTMVMTPVQRGDTPALLATGEPVELARRFCIANRFYGSRVLIGPRTFEMANKSILARPIDFLSGVDVRERHEIYEPIGLASDATPDETARRDAFWNGVVLYREKRWAEAYSQFQKARGPNEQDDAPLQLYLRRLEPLALHLVESP